MHNIMSIQQMWRLLCWETLEHITAPDSTVCTLSLPLEVAPATQPN